MKSESNYSSAIAFLRLPLTLLVVFIHVPYITMGRTADYIHEFWIDGICSVAVPAFFFISGYLFCPVKFSWQVYGEKLKRRIHTLLIPYMAWNLIALLVLIVPHFHDFDYSPTNVLAVFVDCRYSFLHTTGGSPIDYPLWYIRDLMVCCVLSPLFYATWGLKRLVPVIFLILWICEISLPIGASSIAVCYFTLGGVVRIYGFPLMNKPKFWLASVVFILCIYIVTGLNHTFHSATMPIIVLSLFPFGEWILAKNHRCERASKYGSLAFVLYAYHAIFIKKIWNLFIAFGVHQSVAYCLTYISVLIVCAMIYFFIRKSSVIYGILTGKRITVERTNI